MGIELIYKTVGGCFHNRENRLLICEKFSGTTFIVKLRLTLGIERQKFDKSKLCFGGIWEKKKKSILVVQTLGWDSLSCELVKFLLHQRLPAWRETKAYFCWYKSSLTSADPEAFMLQLLTPKSIQQLPHEPHWAPLQCDYHTRHRAFKSGGQVQVQVLRDAPSTVLLLTWACDGSLVMAQNCTWLFFLFVFLLLQLQSGKWIALGF